MEGTKELTLVCAECGAVAAIVRIAPPGAPLPERAIPMRVGEWRYEVEVPGLEGMSATTNAEGAALLDEAVAARDVDRLHGWGRPIAAAVCRECRAVYCQGHMTVRRVFESDGAPMYDYYFEKVCWKGHRGTYERD